MRIKTTLLDKKTLEELEKLAIDSKVKLIIPPKIKEAIMYAHNLGVGTRKISIFLTEKMGFKIGRAALTTVLKQSIPVAK